MGLVVYSIYITFKITYYMIYTCNGSQVIEHVFQLQKTVQNKFNIIVVSVLS